MKKTAKPRLVISDKDIEQLTKLASGLRKEGAHRFKYGEFEVEFDLHMAVPQGQPFLEQSDEEKRATVKAAVEAARLVAQEEEDDELWSV